MSLFVFKIAAALIIVITSLLVGLKPLRRSQINLHSPLSNYGEAFAGGLFLGIAFMHLLPEAQADLNTLYGHLDYPFANLLCMAGFVLLFLVEKVILHNASTMELNLKNTSIPYILPLVLSVHALTEGMALGVNTVIANVLIIFIAIIMHKGSESFALALHLGRSGLPRARSMLIFLLWASMSPVGILLGSIMAAHLQSRTGLLTAAIFNALAAGTFIYIATLHKTNHLDQHRSANHRMEFLMLLLGLLMMALIEIVL